LNGRRPSFACAGCSVDVDALGEVSYMVTVRTWQDAVGGGLLCIGCLESRLRRELTPDDFSHAFINQGAYGRSPRLRARLTGKAFLHTNRLPRARALRNFIDQLGIVVKVRSDRRPLPADLSCSIFLRRGCFSTRVSLPVGWTTREHAVECSTAEPKADHAQTTRLHSEGIFSVAPAARR